MQERLPSLPDFLGAVALRFSIHGQLPPWERESCGYERAEPDSVASALGSGGDKLGRDDSARSDCTLEQGAWALSVLTTPTPAVHSLPASLGRLPDLLHAPRDF